MQLHFVTKNKHKVKEVQAIMKGFDVVQAPFEKYEPKEMNLQQVAQHNALKFFNHLQKPVVVEDTGIFFSAYKEFPGNHPKLMYQLLGYKGLLKLLENESRDVYFKSVVGYCDTQGVKTFEGILACVAATKVYDDEKDVMPYERILMVDNLPLSRMSRDQKNAISHRAKAFEKLGSFLRKL